VHTGAGILSMANAGPIPSYETFVNRLYIQFIFKISVCASHPMKFICAFATSELYILACSLSICLLHLCVHPIWITFSICLLISVFFIFLSCLLKFSIRIIYTCRDFIGTLERKYQSKFSIWGITVLATEEVVFIYMTFYYQHVFLLQNSEAKLCQLFLMVVITAYP